MSKTHLVCYADKNMTISQNLLVESAWKHGIHNAVACSPESISDEFKSLNQDIWTAGNRGADCFWLFKPLVLYKTMFCDFVKDGDIIFYSDAGTEIVNNLNYIVDKMNREKLDCFLFSGRFKQAHWTKGDVIHAINHTNLTITPTHSGNIITMNGFEEFPQIQASQMFFRVNDDTRAFVKRWLLWCQMPGLIDDSPSQIPNHPEFRESRHDQSLLTALQIQFSIPLHWWPALMNQDRKDDFQNDNYPSLFDHHRKRNNEYI